MPDGPQLALAALLVAAAVAPAAGNCLASWDSTAGGVNYYMYDVEKIWSEAKEECTSRGLRLAKWGSQEQFDAIIALIGD